MGDRHSSAILHSDNFEFIYLSFKKMDVPSTKFRQNFRPTGRIGLLHQNFALYLRVQVERLAEMQ
jgi:hypothetical protein